MQGRSTSNILKTMGYEPALQKHVARFADKNGDYSPSTVEAGLNKIHSSGAKVKGMVISTFNATHSSSNVVCPVTHGHFEEDEATGYAKHLHMGTTRVWNADGTINEERWEKFVAFVTAGQEFDEEKKVPYSKLRAYLDLCYKDDEAEMDTGRNANSVFSSKYVQGTAATKAWDEVYDRLTCGWIEKDGSSELEPYITLNLVREFFEDSRAAFQKAQDGELPVAKPAELAPARLGV